MSGALGDACHQALTDSFLHPSAFDKGDVVATKKTGEHGVVRFVGTTYFASGTWIGVEFDRPRGRHDGLVSLSLCLSSRWRRICVRLLSHFVVPVPRSSQVLGHRYFLCRQHHGIFLRPDALQLVQKLAALEAYNASMPEDHRQSPMHRTEASWDIDAVVEAATAAAVASIHKDSEADSRRAMEEDIAAQAAVAALHDFRMQHDAGLDAEKEVVDVSYGGFSDGSDHGEGDAEDMDPPHHDHDHDDDANPPLSAHATREDRVESMKVLSPSGSKAALDRDAYAHDASHSAWTHMA